MTPSQVLIFACPCCAHKTGYSLEQYPMGKEKKCKSCGENFKLTRQNLVNHPAAQEIAKSEALSPPVNSPSPQENILNFYCPNCQRKTSYLKAQNPFGQEKICKSCGKPFILSLETQNPFPSSPKQASSDFDQNYRVKTPPTERESGFAQMLQKEDIEKLFQVSPEVAAEEAPPSTKDWGDFAHLAQKGKEPRLEKMFEEEARGSEKFPPTSKEETVKIEEGDDIPDFPEQSSPQKFGEEKKSELQLTQNLDYMVCFSCEKSIHLDIWEKHLQDCQGSEEKEIKEKGFYSELEASPQSPSFANSSPEKPSQLQKSSSKKVFVAAFLVFLAVGAGLWHSNLWKGFFSKDGGFKHLVTTDSTENSSESVPEKDNEESNEESSEGGFFDSLKKLVDPDIVTPIDNWKIPPNSYLLVSKPYKESSYPKSFKKDGFSTSTQPLLVMMYDYDEKVPTYVQKSFSALEKNPQDLEVLKEVSLQLTYDRYATRAVPYLERYFAAGGAIYDLGDYTPHVMTYFINGLNHLGRWEEAIKYFKLCQELWPGHTFTDTLGIYMSYERLLITWTKDQDFAKNIEAIQFPLDQGWVDIDYYYLMQGILEQNVNSAAHAGKLPLIIPQMEKGWALFSHRNAEKMKKLLKDANIPVPEALNQACDPLVRGGEISPLALSCRGLYSLQMESDYQSAVIQCEQAHRRAKTKRERFYTMHNLIDVHREAGNVEKASRLTQDYAEMSKEANSGYKRKARFLKGKMHEAFGNYSAAAAVYLEIAKEEKKEMRTADSSFVAYHTYFQAVAQTGDVPDETRSYFQNRVNYLKRTDHVFLLVPAYYDLGVCLSRQKKYEDAVEAFKKGLQTITKRKGKKAAFAEYQIKPSLKIKLYLEMAEAYMQNQDRFGAEDAYNAAAVISKKTQKPSSWWPWQLGLARVHYIREKKEKSKELIKEVLKSIQKQRTGIQGNQVSSSAFNGTSKAFELAINFALEEKNKEKAFDLAESARARSILNMLGNKLKSKKQKTRPAKIKEIRKAASNYKVVIYFQLEKKLLVWIIGRRYVKMFTLPVSQKEIKTSITKFRESIFWDGVEEKIEDDTGYYENKKPKDLLAPEVHAQEIYKKIWSPLSYWLTSGENVCVIPHQDLHMLPFQALHDGKRFLVQKYNIFYSPSASSLTLLSKHQFHSLKNLTVFEALLDKDPNSPFGVTETPTIQKMYPQGRFFIREEATPNALRKEAPKAGIIHLSCHGYFDTWIPLFSGLALSGTPEDHEGIIRAKEIYGMDLRKTQLVVMSSCLTSLGDINGGDEMTGLTRAFQAAGVPNVIGSLWSVPNDGTTRMMIRFYEELRHKSFHPVRSLALAQRAMIRNSKIYEWAAFQVTGVGFIVKSKP